MQAKILLGLAFFIMLLFSGCVQQPSGNQNAAQASANKTVLPASAGNYTQTPSGTGSQTVHYISKDAKVTISDISCKVVDLYTGIEAHAMEDKGARYAKTYEIQASGYMSGSENASLSFSISPALDGEKDLSCNDWTVNNAWHTCKRGPSMPEESKWSYHIEALGEQVAEDPNQEITIAAIVNIGNSQGEAEAKVSCPKVEYD